MHDYSSPDLAKLIAEAIKKYGELAEILHAIQTKTGIPGFHTNINSDDLTPGVLERIQCMHEEDVRSLGVFMDFDKEEV